MSLSAAVSPVKQRKMAEGQFVADLAGLFERRGVGTGDAFNCTELEHLLRDSDSFRSQLFSLCTAISHMSDHDLSGEELLDLLARALRLPDNNPLPGDLRMLFVSGLDAWNSRSLQQQDEWPPIKKPVGTVAVMPPAPQPGATVRPAGVPTLQEAIEVARSRGQSSGGIEHQAPMEAALQYPELNSLAIQDLNILLGEIEGRMRRLQPQLVAAAARAVDPSPTQFLDLAAREAAFLERHPYLSGRRPPQTIDQVAIPVAVPTVVVAPELPRPEETKAELAVAETELHETELHLMPRSYNEVEEEPGPPRWAIPDAERFKVYAALAAVVFAALFGTPICAVMAYRYMHPLYVYQAPPPQVEPSSSPVAQPVADEEPADVAATAASEKHIPRLHKQQPVRRQPAVAVWPPPRQ